jgi:hypothetical protein
VVLEERLKCEKLTDDGRRTTSDGKSSHCLWQDELKRVILFLSLKARVIFLLTEHKNF